MVCEDVTGRDLKAARVLAGLKQVELGRLAFLSGSAIARLEAFDDQPVNCAGPTMHAVQAVLLLNGVAITKEGLRRISKEAAAA